MSTSILFSIGTRAMTASYAAMQTTGNNIARQSAIGVWRSRNSSIAASARSRTGSSSRRISCRDSAPNRTSSPRGMRRSRRSRTPLP